MSFGTVLAFAMRHVTPCAFLISTAIHPSIRAVLSGQLLFAGLNSVEYGITVLTSRHDCRLALAMLRHIADKYALREADVVGILVETRKMRVLTQQPLLDSPPINSYAAYLNVADRSRSVVLVP